MEHSNNPLRLALIAGSLVCAALLGVSAPASAQLANNASDDASQAIPVAHQGGRPHGGGGAQGSHRQGGRQHGDHARQSHRNHQGWSDRRYLGGRDDWRRPDWRYSGVNRYHDRWRSGRWYHGHHGTRLGWWWTFDDDWFPYDVPVYPYPDPEVTPPPVYYDPNAVQAPPPPPTAPGQPPLVYDPYTNQYKPEGAATSYYYCYNPAGYYPMVTECPSGWVAKPPG